jgi:hypothetical protein
MSGAWGALGGRKSAPPAPVDPSPEALANVARAKEVLRRDRLQSAAARASIDTSREHLPSPVSLEIAAWIAAEIADVPVGSAPLTVDAGPCTGVRMRPGADADFMDGDTHTTHARMNLADLELPMALADLVAPAADEDAGLADDEASPADNQAQTADDEAGASFADSSGPEPTHSLDEAAAFAADEESGERAAIDSSLAREGAGFDTEAPSGLGEPIRTRTMARLLASQGYLERALTIYEHLLAEQPDDPTLCAETEAARRACAQKSA